MKSIITTVASLLLGLGIAIGIAQAGATDGTTTGAENYGDTVEVSWDEDVVFKPIGEGPGKGACEGGSQPRCYRPECPSNTVCPAQDQCIGKASCFLIRRYDGALNCSMSGECRPSSGSIVIQ